MKEMMEKLGISENRFWGLSAILPFILLIIDILWWTKLNKEEKLLSLTILISWALICVLGIIPLVGAILALIMLILHIIAIVRFFKGDINHKIPVASKIAAKFIKD